MASQASKFSDLEPDEMVARSAIFPRYIEDGVFSKRALLLPDPLDPEDKKRTGTLAISVASMKLLAEEHQIHSYGCRTASMQNRRVFASTGIETEIDKRKFYRGYYDMKVAAIKSLNSASYTIEVKSVPENDEEAHCEIRLVPKQGSTNRDLKNARTDIIVSLGKLLISANSHDCASDTRFASYIASMFIPAAQAT